MNLAQDNTITTLNLQEEYGELISPKELSAFLKIDQRTLLKHAKFCDLCH